MTFPLAAYLASFVCAGAGTALAVPLVKRWAARRGLVDDPGHRKIHAAPVPLAGGLAIAAGLMLAVLGGTLAVNLGAPSGAVAEPLGHGFSRRALQLGVMVAGAFGMLALGCLDDRIELRPATKFAGQLIIASVVAAAGIRITLFVPSVVFSYAITILWILTLTNAFNFVDNMNGLCAGLGLIASWSLAWSAATHGQYLVASLAFATCGALAGFLPFNYPRASVFLGDAGSHLVGYLLAILAILPHYHTAAHPKVLSVFAPVVALLVPLLDLAAVVVLRWRMGRPIYVGDNNHFSHRLVRRGCSRSAAVAWLWLAAAVAGVASIMLGGGWSD